MWCVFSSRANFDTPYRGQAGFAFVGPTTMHALMEAIGIVDTHLVIRQPNERFLDTYRRVGIEPFKTAVYGAESQAA